ncbi:MAG: hypothetical protein ACE5IK_01855 [Acidobacteriota bacterium]
MSATILELAGYSEDFLRTELKTDGRSLLPALVGRKRPRRDGLLVQDFHKNKVTAFPGWQAFRAGGWKYVLYDTGEEELYSLRDDPFELESQDQSAGREALEARQRLRARLEQTRGLMFMSTGWQDASLPGGQVGVPYEFALAAVGGTPPYTWSQTLPPALVVQNCNRRLPAGLSLLSDGTIRGIPREVGCFSAAVILRDSSVSPQHGGPQEFIRAVRLFIDPAG